MFITTKCVDKRNLYDMIKNDESLREVLFDEKINEVADKYLIVNDITRVAHSYYISQFPDEYAKTKYKASKISIKYIIDNKVLFADDFGVFEWNNKEMSYKLIPVKTEKYQQYLYNKFGESYLAVLKDYSNEVFSYQLETINTALYFEDIIQKEICKIKKSQSFNGGIEPVKAGNSIDEVNLSKSHRETEQVMRLASIENLASINATRLLK